MANDDNYIYMDIFSIWNPYQSLYWNQDDDDDDDDDNKNDVLSCYNVEPALQSIYIKIYLFIYRFYIFD